MSEKIQKSLSLFMKKQASEKSSKKVAKKATVAVAKDQDKDKKDTEKDLDKEQESPEQAEMTDEEKLEDAKKASRNKAAQLDQTEMFKKLILQSIVKYTVIIAGLVIFTVGIIKLGPAVAAFFNGFVYKLVMQAATR